MVPNHLNFVEKVLVIKIVIKKDKSIIGYIVVDKILEGDLNYILSITNYTNHQDIIDYFDGCDKCYALHISEYHKFLLPIKLDYIKSHCDNFSVPHFYIFI